MALAGVTALSLAFAPLVSAQTSQAPGDQTSTVDKTNSKDLNSSLDKNPSTAPTDSAEDSATKSPSDASTQAQETPKPPSSTSTTQATTQASNRISDKQFLVKAAQGGMTEVQLGKLAQEKAASPDVKQFGSKMVADHSRANDQLNTVAAKEGVTVPTKLDSKHQAMVDHLQRLSGPAFDKAYVKMMVRDHETDAAEFRQASANAQNPDVKTFASDTLKVIESHLSDIKSIQNTQK
jgi:putative membrane protein